MTANRDTLHRLAREGTLRLSMGALFAVDLAAKAPSFDFERIEGMLLGLAVGDALGVTTEAMLPQHRAERYGEIRDYLPNRYVSDGRGYPSDDTQLSFWTLEQLIEDRGFVPENVARRFSRERIFGLGATVRGFLRASKSGSPWYESGPESAGNGALMRIAPMLAPHLRSGGTDLWVDTALSAMMTHNDRASTSACLAFVAMLWEVLDMAEPPPRDWWVRRYVECAADLEGETAYQPRGGRFTNYRGPLWRFVEQKVSWADRQGLSVGDACQSWHSGAYLLETVPSVLYILMHCGADFEEAVVRAVNDSKDNDTIAAIVGAAAGALHGRKGIPRRWIENLSGRTGESDDGAVFALIQAAAKTFWES